MVQRSSSLSRGPPPPPHWSPVADCTSVVDFVPLDLTGSGQHKKKCCIHSPWIAAVVTLPVLSSHYCRHCDHVIATAALSIDGGL